METVLTLFLQIVKMFIMLGVGYYLYKKNITDDKIVTGLSNLLLFLSTPATLLNSFIQEYSTEKTMNLAFAFIAAFALHVVFVIAAEIIYKKDEGEKKFGIPFSNAGFIGIPLVTGVFGAQAVFYLAPFIGMFNIFVWSYGIWIMSRDLKEVSFKKIITNPAIVALIAGVIIYMLKIGVPSPIHGAVSGFAGLNTPLAMLVLGAHVARGNLKDIFTSRSSYINCFFRLVLMPLIAIGLMAIIPSRWNEVKMIMLIAASAPIGALSPVFARMYNRDSIYAAQSVCLSTLLSILTMPIMMMIAQMFW